MAEAAVFGVCSVVLSTIASPAFRSKYKSIKLIGSALLDLEKLKRRMEEIKAVLLDAEKKQSIPAIKLWVTRVQDVLYQADDLFDEVATNDILRKAKKVRDSPSTLSMTRCKVIKSSVSFARRIAYKKSIAKRVKGIGKELDELCRQMGQYNFINSPPESENNYGTSWGGGSDPGFLSGVSEVVIGRVKEKETVLEWVLGQSNNDATQKAPVLAIVGIGGMGKTTLARLVLKDDRVETRFKKNRWFVSIPNTASDEEFVRKIYLSITEGNEGDLPSGEVQRNKIEEALKGGEFLLVLDNVWEDDRGRWHNRMGLLRGGRNGGKIIVTTRSDLVATAVGAQDTYKLEGLSDEESWDLLRSIVRFTPEQERDPEWAELGREIVEKGKNVPLAIRSIASLLSEKNTIQEWRSLRNEVLSKLGKDGTNDIMRVLKFSYDHLSPTLKRCLTYLSFFKKGSTFSIEAFTYLWISQGFVKARVDDQDEGLSCFMGLVRRSFLLQVYVIQGSRLGKWKMHDLIYELAQDVAAEESIILKPRSTEVKCHRHLNVTACPDNSWLDVIPLSDFNRLRSFQYYGSGSSSGSTLSIEPLLPKFKSLRALWLVDLGIETVPSSIGELIHLRFLDISCNPFRELPDAITNLLNLCLLCVSDCKELEVFPSEFRRLTNIRGLYAFDCDKLMGMPPCLNELTYLEDLPAFHVSREMERSKLDVLPTLKLKRSMTIVFHDDETDDWNEMEFWRPPPTLEWLLIKGYRGVRIPKWSNDEPTLMITSLKILHLSGCSGVKCLPPLAHLPKVSYIELNDLCNLEYIQGEEKEGSILPNLEVLVLINLKSLRDWSGQLTHDPRLPTRLGLSFPSLTSLSIKECPNLNHFPSCPSLETLVLESVEAKVLLQHLMPKHISLPSDNTPQSSLHSVSIHHCNDLVIFPGESFTSLRSLDILGCPKLEKVELPPLEFNNLQELALSDCEELELWDENKRSVRWDSLANITMLNVKQTPSSGKLPDCLQQRFDSGLLQFPVWKMKPEIVRFVDSLLANLRQKLFFEASSSAQNNMTTSTPISPVPVNTQTVDLLDDEDKSESPPEASKKGKGKEVDGPATKKQKKSRGTGLKIQG